MSSSRTPLATRLRPLFILGGLLLPASATATVTTPFPGLQLVRDGQKAMIIADLCAPGVSVRATKYAERKATPQTWGAARGLQAAMNADFFNFPAATYVLGRARGGGEDWPAAAQMHENHHYFEFGPGLAQWINPGTTAPDPAATEIIGTHNVVIMNGVASDDGALGDLHPRSAVGLNLARTRLYMFTSKDSITGAGISSAMFAMSAEANGGTSDIDVGLNVDGGGSTQMYVQGQGQIIDSGRLVANHLGVFATGAGASPQCPVPLFPPIVRRSSTDIDGDGTADICARSSNGVLCELVKDGKMTTEVVGPPWTDTADWNKPQYASTVQFADVNGDGKADVCGRAGVGMICWLSDGAAFPTTINGPAWSDASDWGSAQYYSTIQLPDIDGDGKADICGRAGAGIVCWLSDGKSFPTAVTGPAWSDASGWNLPVYYSTIQYPDINGDGKADVCARSAASVTCWLSDGKSFPTSIEGPAWADTKGWGVPATGSTVRFIDLNGDKKADVCGRAADGIHCSLSTGTGFGPDIVGPLWSDASGWAKPEYYGTILYPDINGDGKADICGRTADGVICQLFDGAAFGPPLTGPAWSDAAGWNEPKYYSTIGAADVNHDGRDDLCARTADGVICAPSNGHGFDATIVGPAWSDASGWGVATYYSSIRYVGTPTTTLDSGDPDAAGDASTGGQTAGAVPSNDGSGDGCACGATPGKTGAASGVALLLFALAVPFAARRRRPR